MSGVPSAAYAITMRLELDDQRTIGAVTTVVSSEGGVVSALDVIDAGGEHVVVDLICNAANEGHSELLRIAVEEIDGCHVRSLADRTFDFHFRGTISVAPRAQVNTRDDLSMAYTPGVARISSAIAKDPGLVRDLTIKQNTVAVVTDGSAVLGLGNIGPEAALPVMEGKALLFKRFADVDAWPVCLATQDTDEIVRIVECLAPVYGGINLEDIAAPRCFVIERMLRERLDIPVVHDDQHGTAIVTFAALLNSLQVVGKTLQESRVAILGMGAAGIAISRLLLAEGVGEILGLNRGGILDRYRSDLDDERRSMAEITNFGNLRGGLDEALRGTDVFIGVSGPDLVTAAQLATMAPDSIVFALANPDPEIDPALARRHAAIVATGRSDEPNQINNALVFPGLFRGLLDARATELTEAMEIAVGKALAAVVGPDELSPGYVIPSIFNPAVVPAVAGAVAFVPGGGR